jgi:drug/metabolite transporter (DMT)-like permease
VNQQARGAICGLCAAALFGLSAPLAKVLLGSIAPVLLAGLLYLGAALGLWAHRLLAAPTKEAKLQREDIPKLVFVVLAGGVVAPVLMLLGLNRVTALTGSLLLNLEAPFTLLLAVLLFREHLGRYAAIATLLILSGALLLKLDGGVFGGDAVGVLLLAAACACWALDNNLTQKLSVRDPFAIVRVKTLVAGAVNVGLGLSVAQSTLGVPSARYVLGALLLGSLSYGVSVVLDAYALRFVGAAREAAYFASAPFVGALGSVVIVGDSLGWSDALAMALMALGVGFLLRERHAHEHEHDELEHEHLHEHDEHHQHAHSAGDAPGEPHSHVHRHERLRHDHPHVSDAHHRHRH